MSSFNKTILVGNLTRDPELRLTPKGTAICQFGLACNRQFKSDAGTLRDEVLFIDIEAWGKQGELVAKYLQKGSQVLIEGRLKLDSWTDTATQAKRTKIKVVMETVQFLGSKPAVGLSDPPARPAATPKPEGAPDEDVPY